MKLCGESCWHTGFFKILFLLRHNLHTVKCIDVKCYSSMNFYVCINLWEHHLDRDVDIARTPEGYHQPLSN